MATNSYLVLAATLLGGGLLVGCGDSDESNPPGSGPSGGGGVGGPSGGASHGGGGAGIGAEGAGASGAGECTPVAPTQNVDLHVSPDGTPSGRGTMDDPLDLATALSDEGPAQPGDVVALHAGTYEGRFQLTVDGTESEPIRFVAAAGEHVVLDGNVDDSGAVLTIHGAWVEVEGLEIMNSTTDRVSQQTGSSPSDLNLSTGVTVYGVGAKVLNNVIHDGSTGVGFWTSAIDAEVSGNIIYNNGWEAPDRGHGHSIYTQNADGTKRIADNVLFYGMSFGIHAYTENGDIEGFDVEGNVWFLAGASTTGDGDHKDNCLIGGLQPAGRVRLDSNMSWAPEPSSRNVRLGYGVPNQDAIVTNNLLVGVLNFAQAWESLEMSGNTLHGDVQGVDTAMFPDNDYAPPDEDQVHVVLRKNAHDPGRAHLYVFDAAATGTVSVELDPVVPIGHRYVIRSVFDMFGEPLVEGVSDGAAVSVPVGTIAPPQPIGLEGAIEPSEDPGAELGVFVITHQPCE